MHGHGRTVLEYFLRIG